MNTVPDPVAGGGAVTVREATVGDAGAIDATVRAAFGADGGDEIAALVEALLADPTAQPLLSLVATAGADVIGHVLFTPVSVAAAPVPASILAPLSVHPAWQRQGVGGRLINEGLSRLAAAGVVFVFVLGHPDYYPRYGFRPAGAQGLEAPYRIAPEQAGAWMVQVLDPARAAGITGTVACAAALDDPRHWQE